MSIKSVFKRIIKIRECDEEYLPVDTPAIENYQALNSNHDATITLDISYLELPNSIYKYITYTKE
jgi:hypothetical protein